MRTLRITREHFDALQQLVEDYDADEIRIARDEPGDEKYAAPAWEDDDATIAPITIALRRESDEHFDAVAEITHDGRTAESVNRA